MKVFCLAGLARSSLLHTACLTCNIFSDFSYTHAFIQLLENGQVDSAETAEIAESPQISFPSRINHIQPTIISVHGNKANLYEFLCHMTPVFIFQVKRCPGLTFC